MFVSGSSRFPFGSFADRSAAGKLVSFPVCRFSSLCDVPLELFWMSHDDSGLEKEGKERKGKKVKKEGRSREKKPSSNAYAALGACVLLLGIPIIFLGITA